MKKITLLIASALTAFGLSAQIADTVSTGAGYANGVYYSLEKNEVHTVEAGNWDIAFSVSGMGSTIRTNGGHGIELYNYPNGDTSHWSSMDTVGLSGWKKYYNSDSLWSTGAFSQAKSSDMMDMGWGKYSMITHYVTADSLFVIKLQNGSYKKLWIDRLASSVFYFKYADLDGSNEIMDTIKKADYLNKSFGYYSIENGLEIDREPDNSTWDLLFTKYGQAITSTYYMGVSGILVNDGVSANKVSNVHTEEADTLSTPFSHSMTSIGYNWKSLNYATYKYAAEDSLTYFVKSKDGDFWKLVLTDFGGSANGDYHFTKQKIVTTGGAPELNISSVGTYPNPASDILNIVFDQKNADEVRIEVYNISGVSISSQSIYGNGGLNTLRLDVGNYASGLYMVNVSSQGGSVLSKVLVK